MRNSVKTAILALTLAVLTLPSASATWVYKSGSGSAVCDFGACTVNVYHDVSSDSDWGDCTGTPGAYTSCVVYHSCYVEISGTPLTVGTLYCSSSQSSGSTSGCAVTLTRCSASASEQVVLLRGQCAYFYADAYASSLTDTAYAAAPTLQVCVNGNGPY